MAIKLTKKTYYLITDDKYPDWSVENYGDRKFYVKDRLRPRLTIISDGIGINNDINWDITQENIKAISAELIKQNAAKLAEEEADEKNKESRSWFERAKKGLGW